MKSLRIAVVFLMLPVFAFAAEDPNTVKPKQSHEEKAPPEKVPDVNTIVSKANLTAYYQGNDGKAKVLMTITDRNGQKREREFMILRKDVNDGEDQKYYVYFHKPADVRKMVYMVHKRTDPQKDDDRWLYLPALDLVKRIAAGDKRTSFVGSDFLYEDVSGRSLDEDTHELVKVTDKLFVVKNVPKQSDAVEFSYYDVSIDRETYVPLKMEYFDRNNKLHRVIESREIKRIQQFPTVVKSVVTDLKTGSTTEMEFTEVKYDIDLEDIFTERYLRRPPREALR